MPKIISTADAKTTPASYAAAAGTKAPTKVSIHRFVERFILRHLGLQVATNTSKATTGDGPACVRPCLTDCEAMKETKIADIWTYNGTVVIKDLTGKIIEVGGPAVLIKL